ncbi:MAG TPA: Fur family transcriptional regulator [Anaerolineae bacterium]|nr:Fur family transcriptional regulator [Anaerolineae bacterium]
MTDPKTLKTLRATGHRITAQRQVVLEVVESSPKHLDAETIYQRVREKDPQISLATVYRTLSVLKEMGLIEQSYLARNHTREYYEPVGAPEHHHFTCLGCRTVIEFQSQRVKQMRADLQRELGLDISHACICLEGYCRSCAAKRKTVSK